MAAASIRPSRAVNLLLAAAGVVVALGVAEVGARLIDGKAVFTIRNWVTASLEGNTETRTASYHATLGWYATPNLSLLGDSAMTADAPDYSHLRVTTDAHGYRFTGDRSTLSEPEAAPILTVGDSFTWGSEVGDLDTYPAQLQRILDRPVINAAYGGWGTDQIWLRAQQVAAREQPAVIVLSPLTNDVLRNAYRRYGRAFKPYFDYDEGGELVLKNVPVPRNSTRPRDIGWAQWALGRLYVATYAARALGLQEAWVNSNRLYDRVHENDRAVDIACDLLNPAATLSAETGVPVVLALLYGGNEVQQSEPHWFTQRYKACAEDAGLPVVDLWPRLKRAQREPGFPGSHYRIWKAGRIAHMNPNGNRAVAEEIARALKHLGIMDADG